MTMTKTACAGLAAGLLTAVLAVPAQAAGPLVLTTEENAPYNFTDPQSGKVTGLATDLLTAALDREGVAYEIRMLPWKRAYQMALEEPDTCVYGTNRTPEREGSFKWVGPLVHGGWVLFSTAEKPVTLASLDDAKGMTIGVHAGSGLEAFLDQTSGLTLDRVPDNNLNIRKLFSGRIDLWAGGRGDGPYKVKLAGEQGRLHPALVLKETIISLACNPSVDDATIAALNAALDGLRSDGTEEAVRGRYE